MSMSVSVWVIVMNFVLMLLMSAIINGTLNAEDKRSEEVNKKFNKIKNGSYNHKLKKF